MAKVEWLDRLEREHDNLRAVLSWLLEEGEINQSKREMALRLAGAMLTFWDVHGHWSAGWDFLARALAGYLDAGTRAAHGRAARQAAVERFSLDACLDGYLRLRGASTPGRRAR